MLAVATECDFEIQRGPDWLLVRLKNIEPSQTDSPPLTERLWALLEQHFTYRLVLELDEVPLLSSALVEQLFLLYHRIKEKDGVMRLCGLSPYNRRVLHACRLDERLHPYRDRQEAVLGRPRQPR
ncbi:MAG: STAS domain-containing protein [Pirellulales bacterium]|nr:STAS domain-containing protein [Pirellulales bacterium]